MDLQKCAALVEYDGALFHGFQLQRDTRTVQLELESALSGLSGGCGRVEGASRTDTGVHASGQVVSFWVKSGLSIRTVVQGMNYYLPGDVALRGACFIDGGFDVRRRAVARQYRYKIVQSGARAPLSETASLRVGHRLDVDEMRRACRALIGSHDFGAFATELDGTVASTVRVVHEAKVVVTGDVIEMWMTANAFLRHQVRNTVGQLVRVGMGRCSADEFAALVDSDRRSVAGPAAVARGLCLVKVSYDTPLGFAS